MLSTWGLGVHTLALLVLTVALNAPSDIVMIGCLAAIGAGAALFTTPNNHAILSSVAADQRGIANAVRSTVQNASGLTGTAIVSRSWPRPQ